MKRIIGNADEFYRLRIVNVDVSDAPDLEWREDILWRRPAPDASAERVVRRVEAVETADDESAWRLGDFATTGEAHAFLDEVTVELAGMTKSQFEDAYLSDPGAARAAEPDSCADTD